MQALSARMVWIVLLALNGPALALESDPAQIIDLGEGADEKGAAELIPPEVEAQTAPGLPHVVIDPSGEARPGCWMLLDASRSSDPGHEELTFEWCQSAGPGLKLPADELLRPKLWLFFSQRGEYRLALRAKNATGWSKATVVKLSVRGAPAALEPAEARRILGAGERVELPGEGWTQAEGPRLDLRVEQTCMSCRPIKAGLYIFEAPRAGDVPERRGVRVLAGQDGTWGNRRPIAEFLTKNPVGEAQKALVLDATLSRDPDGPEESLNLQARWMTQDRQRSVRLEPLPGLKARFTARRAGTYSVELVVSDGKLESQPPERIFVRIEEQAEHLLSRPHELEGWEDVLDPVQDDVRYRKVRLSICRSTLERAVQRFPNDCELALRVETEVALPADFHKIPLNVEVQNGALMHLLDWIARQTNTRYRRENDRSIWLTNCLGLLKTEKLESVAEPVDALYERKDASDLLNQLLPCFQQLLETRENANLGFEPEHQKIVGALPTRAKQRLREVLASLRAPTGEGLPPTSAPLPFEPALRKRLAEKTVTLKQRAALDYLLRNLAEVSGVAVGFNPRDFPEGLPQVEVNIEDAPLRDAVRTIVDAAGFDGCAIEPPDGLFCYRGQPPYPSGELLWDHAQVRAYDLAQLLNEVAPLTAEAIVHAIKQRVYPASWKDAGALCFYHAPTRKLLVMHGPAAQRKVLDFLWDLRERGEWALGPIEEAPAPERR